jgi:hypothetical protein
LRNVKKRSVIGDIINFRGMGHAPTNEQGVVALFAMVARDLGYYIQEIGTAFPDCTARRETERGWEEVAIEFEFESHSFREHGHDPTQCDVLVCWKHTLLDLPADIEVIRLSEQIRKLSAAPITRSDRPF